jgi:hypothetical protein
MMLDWTIALFFRPDITKVELTVERDQVPRTRPHEAASSSNHGSSHSRRFSSL